MTNKPIEKEMREQLDVLWEKAYSGGLKEHRKDKDISFTLQEILKLIRKFLINKRSLFNNTEWSLIRMKWFAIEEALLEVDEGYGAAGKNGEALCPKCGQKYRVCCCFLWSQSEILKQRREYEKTKRNEMYR